MISTWVPIGLGTGRLSNVRLEKSGLSGCWIAMARMVDGIEEAMLKCAIQQRQEEQGSSEKANSKAGLSPPLPTSPVFQLN